MNRSSLSVRWMLVIVFFMLLIFRAIVTDAAPAVIPMLGFTPTATVTETVTATATATETATATATTTVTATETETQVCIPVITKRCHPATAGPGEEVTCIIVVTNKGRAAAVNAQIIDHLPDYLDILDVVVDPGDQGGALPWRDQEIVINVGTIGQDFEVKVVIHARVRENAPPSVCIENVAEFRADNCPNREDAVICTLPETGGSNILWKVASAMGTVILVLSLILAERRRS